MGFAHAPALQIKALGKDCQLSGATPKFSYSFLPRDSTRIGSDERPRGGSTVRVFGKGRALTQEHDDSRIPAGLIRTGLTARRTGHTLRTDGCC